jgi:iron complex transport system substrate-binding protein
MVNKRSAIIAVIVVVALVAAGMFAFIGLGNNKSKTAGAIEIIDALGNNVTLNSTPMKVVSASPSTTELLYAIGASGSIVGVTDYCDYPLNTTGKSPKEIFASIGGFYSPSFEKIASLDPDLVLLDGGVKKQKDLMPQLDSVGIKYVALYPGKNVTEIKNNIRYVGQIFDKEAKSNSLISEMEQKLTSISNAVSNSTSKPKVMVMVAFSPTIYVNGGNTFINDIINAAGGINVFGNASGYATISKEGVVQANPDVIIVTASMIPGLTAQEVLDQIKGDVLLQNTQAAINNKVYVLESQAESCFLRQGIRVVQATQLLADMLYPATFGETIPNVMGNEYVNYLPDSWNTNSTSARTVMTPVQSW